MLANVDNLKMQHNYSLHTATVEGSFYYKCRQPTLMVVSSTVTLSSTEITHDITDVTDVLKGCLKIHRCFEVTVIVRPSMRSPILM